MNFGELNELNLKHQKCTTPSACNVKGIRKFEFMEKHTSPLKFNARLSFIEPLKLKSCS